MNGNNEIDIEKEMEFKERKKDKKKKKSKDIPVDPEREMTAEEAAVLKKFEENDKEIDNMLEGIIDQLDRIKLQAENLGKGIDHQTKLRENLGKKINISWKKLEKKDSDLKKVLTGYRKSNRLKLDICLTIICALLFGMVYSVYKSKGYLPW